MFRSASRTPSPQADRIDKGFFYNIRNYFDGGYHGRYFAILLRELAQNEPHSFCTVIELCGHKSGSDYWHSVATSLRKKQLTVQREYPFPGARNKRRLADLSLTSVEPLLTVLFEIKEHDKSAAGNAAQLEDYLRIVSQSRDSTGLVYISRFAPEEGDYNKITKQQAAGAPVVSIRYHEIYDALRNTRSVKDGVLARMICEYLEDNDMAGYRPIDLTTKGKTEGTYLAFLLTQMLCFPNKHLLGKLHSDAALAAFPDLVAKMFGNVEVIGDWIRQANPDLIKTRFTRRLEIEPHFDCMKLKEELPDSTDEKYVALPDGISEYVGAGTLYFHAEASLATQSGKWLSVVVGFSLYLKKGSPKKKVHPRIRPWVYSYFNGDGLTFENTFEESGYLKRFPDERTAQREFRDVLKKSIKKALHEAVGPTRTALQKFELPKSDSSASVV